MLYSLTKGYAHGSYFRMLCCRQFLPTSFRMTSLIPSARRAIRKNMHSGWEESSLNWLQISNLSNHVVTSMDKKLTGMKVNSGLRNASVICIKCQNEKTNKKWISYQGDVPKISAKHKNYTMHGPCNVNDDICPEFKFDEKLFRAPEFLSIRFPQNFAHSPRTHLSEHIYKIIKPFEGEVISETDSWAPHFIWNGAAGY